jgi:sulfate permease, SulP family
MSQPADPALRRLRAAYRARVEGVGRGVRTWVGEVTPRRRLLKSDLLAGLPGAISSVPDGMAASVLAGVAPSHGLYASFSGPIAGGLTSSTRLMVVTTTSAAALAAGSAIASVPADQRSDAMLWLTLLAGGVMLLAAVVGLSRYVRFVSHSVMLGFLTGVAVNMVLGQLPDLLGVDPEGSLAVQKAFWTLTHPGEVDWPSATSGVVALLLLVVLARTRIAVVSSLVALFVPTVAVLLVGWSSVATVADGGALPTGVPLPTIPDLGALNLSVLGGAASVAVIVLVQGAGVAEAVPNLDGTRTVASRDFTAQGVANVASGLFGGQPVGGSVGQTALNVTAGARSRWASIWSGLWMLAILLAFSQIVGQVLLPTLAAVLVYAGWGTVRPSDIGSIIRAGRIPAIALIATFIAVLVLPVATAVGVGVTASLLLQLNQESLDLRVVRLVPEGERRFREEPAPKTLVDENVLVLDVYGSMFYAGAKTLQHQLPDPLGAEAPVVILRIRGRTTLGATFLSVIGDYSHRLDAVQGSLFLTGVDPERVARWSSGSVPEALGGVRIFEATPEVGAATSSALAAATHRVQVVAEPGPSPES